MILYLLILFVSINIFINTDGTTHWYVNNEEKLQAQMDSIYQLRRPYDFLALMQQEQRSKQVEELKQDLINQKSHIDMTEDKEVQLEDKIYSSYSDCVLAEKPLTEIDLHVGTNFDLKNVGINIDQYLDIDETNGKLLEPNCERYLNLEFSMFSLEHLHSIVDRNNLNGFPEDNLLTLNGQNNASVWGNHVSLSLEKNSTSWILYTLAAQYWRAKNNPYMAIECVRRAMLFSGREYRHIPLLHLGNILHRSRESEDAAVVLYMAVEHDQSSDVIYGTLGSVYASIGLYNASAMCLENALQLSNNQKYKQLKRAVLCHAHLERSLENQLQSLQNTLTDLRDYQRKHDKLLNLQQKLMLEQATPEMKLESRLEYEEQKIRESVDGRGQDCFQYQQDGHTFLSCNMRRDQMEQQGSTEVMLDLQSLLNTVESETLRLKKQVFRKRPTLHGSFPIVIPLNKFNNGGINKFKSSKVFGDDFPTERHCSEVIWPQVQDFPFVFLPPENKLFMTHEYMDGIDDIANTEIYTYPTCPEQTSYVKEVDDIAGIFTLKNTWLHNTEAEEIILQYGKMTRVAYALIHAIEKSDDTHWAAFNLAALFRFVHGYLPQAVTCLRRSILETPSYLLDVPFVNFASIMFASGYTDEALILAKKAEDIDDSEIETNFLLANLNLVKGNMSAAKMYYEKVLLMDSSHSKAQKFYSVVACDAQKLDMKNTQNNTAEKETEPGRHQKKDDSLFWEHDDFEDNSQERQNNGTPKNFEDAVEDDSEGEFQIEDDILPDVLLRVKERISTLIPPAQSCEKVNKVDDLRHFTSTWLSVSAKNIEISDYLVRQTKEGTPLEEPICQEGFPASMHTLDHLAGMKLRAKLPQYAELGLKEAFQTLTDRMPQPMDLLATRISRSLLKNESCWVAPTAAALYWRVMGNGHRAVNCLRQALHFAPRDMKDIPLVSLANIFHRSGLLNDALIVVNMALEISPGFVVVHFTMANIYAGKGDFEKAAAFYQSTLSLQATFEPARDRLRAIQCSAVER